MYYNLGQVRIHNWRLNMKSVDLTHEGKGEKMMHVRENYYIDAQEQVGGVFAPLGGGQGGQGQLTNLQRSRNSGVFVQKETFGAQKYRYILNFAKLEVNHEYSLLDKDYYAEIIRVRFLYILVI